MDRALKCVCLARSGLTHEIHPFCNVGISEPGKRATPIDTPSRGNYVLAVFRASKAQKTDVVRTFWAILWLQGFQRFTPHKWFSLSSLSSLGSRVTGCPKLISKRVPKNPKNHLSVLGSLGDSIAIYPGSRFYPFSPSVR
jgi:hypothetical protein